MRMRGNTKQMMAQFKALIDGIPNIFEEGTDVINVAALEAITSKDEYTDYGGGVCARFIEHRGDIKFPEEEVGRQLLASLPEKSMRQYMLFCKFNEDGAMSLQCHPQQEEGYLLEGGLADRLTGRKWVKGQKFFFERMEKHEPYTPTGCFILLVFTDI